MPPRPAPSSAGRGSSQRQGSDEERAMQLLERLAGAADLGAFVLVHFEEVCCLHGIGPVLRSSVQSGAAAAAGSPGHALLAAWMAAIARGMQLAAQQLDLSRLRQHSEQLGLLCNLLGAIRYCFQTLDRPLPPPHVAAAPDDGREPMRVALSALAVRAGVVKAHEQLSLRLASIISTGQAARSGAATATQQRMEPVVARLVSEHFDVLRWMGRGWSGGLGGLFSPSLCQAVPAAAGLAAAALRSREVLVRRDRANGSTWQAAYDFDVPLCNAYNAFAASGRSVPGQIADSSSVATTQLMWLGLAAERLHHRQRGLSPAAVGAASSSAAASRATRAQQQQQRLAVPAHHTQLLQALGVATSSAHPNSPMAAQDDKYWGVSLRSLLATPGKRQLLVDAAAAASCQLPLLLVVVECALLDPAEDMGNCACAMLHRTLARSEQTAWQLAPSLLRAILERNACRRAVEAAAPVAGVGKAAAGALSVQQVLAPLVMAATKAAMMSAMQCASSSAKDDDTIFSQFMAGVAAVWLEHPAQYASLLEAGLRATQPGGDLLTQAVAASRTVAAAARTRLSAGSGALAADSQQQVFAMLLSCLKAATMAVAAEQGSSSGSSSSRSSRGDTTAGEEACMIRDFAGMVVQDAIEACHCLFLPGGPSSSSGASSSGASNQTSMAAPAAAADAAAARPSAQLGCVLLARCLVAAGRLLQQQAQAPARDGDSRCGDTRLYMHRFSLLVDACCSGVALLGQQLAATAAAAEPWLHQLLEEHTQLAQQLESLQAQMPASGGANPLRLPAAALAGTAEQLQAFGAAVCGALPVQHCCNHHDCRNLEQTSELDLASGKSCVCSGCRVARYCSRECQVAHYKGWHKAVCKRLQAQRQQGAAAQQQQQ